MTAPHRELELKAVVPDPEQLRSRLRKAGAERRQAGLMVDVRYDRDGKLTLHDEVLRARTFRYAEGPAEFVLAWKGPTQRSPDGYKLREEIELMVGADPGELLRALGYGSRETSVDTNLAQALRLFLGVGF